MAQPVSRIGMASLPALALVQEGDAFIVARVNGDQILIHDLAEKRPRAITQEEFEARYEGRLLQLASRASVLGDLAKFDFSWFIPEVAKTTRRDRLMALRAPVDGTVQQLAVHTVGGVVTPAQALLAVVPGEESLEIEATVLNKDIGFVRPGQAVTVKIESFPYTHYGYLTGVVASVSHDAAQDENLGLVFPARIKLDGAMLTIDGTQVHLTSGMSLSAEIKTGKRRVITYLLSPLQQHGSEALRER